MIQSIEKRNIEYLKKWKAGGKKTTFYTCQHCHKKIETPQPTKDSVSSKGYWDSAETCVECRELNFVCVWPNGKTISDKL